MSLNIAHGRLGPSASEELSIVPLARNSAPNGAFPL